MQETATFRGVATFRWPGWLVGGALAAIAGSYLIVLNLDLASIDRIGAEDAIIEQLGALLFLAASVLFVAGYARSAGDGNRFLGRGTTRNVWFLLLAALTFLCFGEEISWGQRLFGWQTPALLDAVNVQGETNLHNLSFFQDSGEGLRLLNANRLLSAFWLAYCVVVPLLASVSGPVRRAAGFFGFPIPPLAIGVLFIANFVIFRTVVALGDVGSTEVASLDELKESIYGLCFFALALCFAVGGSVSVSRQTA